MFSMVYGRVPVHAVARTSTLCRRCCQTHEGLEMTKLALIFVAAGTLLCGTAISNAQDRERPQAAVPQTEGMRRGEGPHNIDVDRNHRHRPIVIIVGVPIFAGPAYEYGGRCRVLDTWFGSGQIVERERRQEYAEAGDAKRTRPASHCGVVHNKGPFLAPPNDRASPAAPRGLARRRLVQALNPHTAAARTLNGAATAEAECSLTGRRSNVWAPRHRRTQPRAKRRAPERRNVMYNSRDPIRPDGAASGKGLRWYHRIRHRDQR